MYIGVLNLAILLSIFHHCVVHTLQACLQSARDSVYFHLNTKYQCWNLKRVQTLDGSSDQIPQTRFGSLVSGLSGILGQYD